jgi:hypothetical protein
MEAIQSVLNCLLPAGAPPSPPPPVPEASKKAKSQLIRANNALHQELLQLLESLQHQGVEKVEVTEIHLDSE